MSSPQSRLDELRIDRPERTEPPRKIWLAAVVVAGALVIGLSLWWATRSRSAAVRTAIAHESISAGGADRTVLNASGYVTARREATVSSKVMGKVTEVLVEEGMKVTAGQVVARLDDTNTKASLLLAQAQLASAKTALEETAVRLKEAEQDLGRQTALRQSGVGPQADFDHAQAAALAFRAKLEQQQADVAVADRTVGIWQQQLDDMVIRAPFAGVITSKDAQPGEMISPMSSGGFTRTGICTIVDMESLEIEIDVNESYINRVTPGQPAAATLDAYPDWRIPCKVIAIIPTADRDKSTVKVRVGFDQLDPRILPEMSAKVAFQAAGPAESAGHPGVLVPKAALQERDGHNVVWVVQGGRVERRAVTTGGTEEDDILIRAGLTAGEKVVVDGPKDLADGAAVKENAP
ncbi:MAG TPA: efflux RND transporter periplasmic adaptor subunit [Opitutaceae bacterium]|nr:efflux RND transporter periplasmic adaptor subunit [Opitutaceae bacterium]